jgi:hypothetical protein
MNKILLLTAVSVIALCTSGALAVPGKSNSFKLPKNVKVLWNQNSNSAREGVSSVNFTSTGTSYDDQAADDFAIPKGKIWKITEVDVTGVYYNGSGPAGSENVIFYKDAKGVPGKAVAKGTFNNLQGVGSYGDFTITLPKGGVRLKVGHYWVSVVANTPFAANWGWEINSTQHGDQAVWQNPGGAFGECETWCTFGSLGLPGPDLMFELKGVSK